MRLLLFSITKNYDDTSIGKSVQTVRVARAGLSPHYSIHLLQHTYPCYLHKASGWVRHLRRCWLLHIEIKISLGVLFTDALSVGEQL